MRRFRFRRRRSFGRIVRRARPIVRAATGITLAKRIILTDLTIADVSAADFDNPTTIPLITTLDDTDEEVESNGTTIAECPLHSRITKMKLNFFVRSSASTLIRWMLLKFPDGEALLTQLTDANFHSSNDVQNNREIRKYTIAKGYFGISSDRLQSRVPMFISRQALARVSPLRENDRIVLIVAKSAEGATATISGFGTIWVKANA